MSELTHNIHTVEKIGGTSMSQHQHVMENIWLRPHKPDGRNTTLYQRIFVVSAYAGMTNALLEHKKTGEPGVYALFSEMDENAPWQAKLDQVLETMLAKNAIIFDNSTQRKRADRFIIQRFADTRACLENLETVCDFGTFQLKDHLHQVREMLSGLGESHSAFNSTLLLRQQGVNATFIDLTNWRSEHQPDLNETITTAFRDVNLKEQMPIVTGYTQCREGLMKTFDRGYSEMTFSKIATITKAREAIIHKEYHLSTADPALVGTDKILPIGLTNFDVADQLANLGMEAIHPRAASGLRKNNIVLRIKNTFEPTHSGTVICNDYCSDTPKVEIIAGTKGVWAIELFDQDMVGEPKYAKPMNNLVEESGLRVLTKDYNANTVTFYLRGDKRRIHRLLDKLQQHYPEADIRAEKLALVSAIGSDLNIPGLMQKASGALAQAGVSILSAHQALRQVDIMFLIAEKDYRQAVSALHEQFVEESALWQKKLA
ncbi:aspartate kinase [Bacterioplanoides sp.]|uniref:aspartate kinase n=1 Tax=Bacterioplanoides sp. TaxID=2066072 RepID=UPI003B5BDC6D